MTITKDELEALEYCYRDSRDRPTYIDGRVEEKAHSLARAALAKLRQPSEAVDEARELAEFKEYMRKSHNSHYGPDEQINGGYGRRLFDAWLARARSGKGEE